MPKKNVSCQELHLLVSVLLRRRAGQSGGRKKSPREQTDSGGLFYNWSVQIEPSRCHHQLKGPPELVAGIAGVSFLLFDCLVCERAISVKVDFEGEVDAELIIPPDLMCA